VADPIDRPRLGRGILAILVPAIIGEAVFYVLAIHQGAGGADAELAVGGGVAGVLAITSSLIFLQAGRKSLL
jgi:hypothetical protein